MAKRATSSDLPRRRRKASPAVKAAADRAEARATGNPVKSKTAGKATPAIAPSLAPSKGGRKPLYKPHMCKQVVELGRAGKSRAQIAAKLGINRNTLYEWERKHPTFGAALAHARDLELAWWEDEGQAGLRLGAKGFNAGLFAFQMKNRFRDTYNDKVDVGLSADSALVKLWEAIGSRKVDGKVLGSHEEAPA